MNGQWRQEKRGDFGWSVEGATEIKAFWLANVAFTDPDASVSGKITESTARVLEEKVAEHAVEITPHPNLSLAMRHGALTAFAIADRLGGGYFIVFSGSQMGFQTIGREEPSRLTSPRLGSGAEPTETRRPFWKTLLGFGQRSLLKRDPTDFRGASGTFRDDRDNSEYRWVRIGKQVWMAEDLRFPLRQGVWKNSRDAIATYYYSRGSLDGACPRGWRAPEKEDFEALIAAVGGEDEASLRLRLGGSSGFDAVAHGRRYDDGRFTNTDIAYFWAANERNQLAWFMEVYPDKDHVRIRETWDEDLKRSMGTPIRCIREPQTSGSFRTFAPKIDETKNTPRTMYLDESGWGRCPRCGVRTARSNPHVWEDNRHKRCGQLIEFSNEPPPVR